jgi:hypothetical protein
MARIAVGSVRAGVEVTAERERVVIGDRQTPQRRMATKFPWPGACRRGPRRSRSGA